MAAMWMGIDALETIRDKGAKHQSKDLHLHGCTDLKERLLHMHGNFILTLISKLQVYSAICIKSNLMEVELEILT